MEMPFADMQSLRQPADAVTVDRSVGDQAHRSAAEIRPDVPLRGAGAGVRPAPLTGAQAGSLRRRGRGEERDVLPLRGDGGTTRPAVDAGGADACNEDAVETAVLGLDRPVAGF